VKCKIPMTFFANLPPSASAKTSPAPDNFDALSAAIPDARKPKNASRSR
jgi:hypothetical protein